MFDLEKIVRKNIWGLKPYSSARDEYTGNQAIFLDANENPYETGYNRYPDPLQRALKDKISSIKSVPSENIFLGNGSDEPIDLLFRIFCEPGTDNCVSIEPSYGMYQVCADINNTPVKKVLLTAGFQLNANNVLKEVSPQTKLIFLCSPNNPTGNSLDNSEIENILNSFHGIVVLDEAYIDFSTNKSFIHQLDTYKNLVVLQTFSKAWGLAGIRLGMAFANQAIIALLTKVKYPYNLNMLTQKLALEKLADTTNKNTWVKQIIQERTRVANELKNINEAEHVYPSDANFLLVKMKQARELYLYLVSCKVVVRDRSKVSLCEGCLRFTIGKPEENNKMLDGIKKFYQHIKN